MNYPLMLKIPTEFSSEVEQRAMIAALLHPFSEEYKSYSTETGSASSVPALYKRYTPGWHGIGWVFDWTDYTAQKAGRRPVLTPAGTLDAAALVARWGAPPVYLGESGPVIHQSGLESDVTLAELADDDRWVASFTGWLKRGAYGSTIAIVDCER